MPELYIDGVVIARHDRIGRGIGNYHVGLS